MIGYWRTQSSYSFDHLVGGAGRLARLLELVALAVLVPQLAGGDVEREDRCSRRPCSPPASPPRGRRRAPRGWTSGSARSPLRRRRRWSSPSSSGCRAACGRSRRPVRTASANDAGAERHDHELLEVDAAVGVRAAVQDVHHRHGQERAASRRRSSRRAARGARRAARPPRARRRAPAPSTRRGARSRRAVPCSACRRARSSAASIAR